MITQILLFDGFDEMDAFGVFEALRMAGLPVGFRTLANQEFVIAAHGTAIKSEGKLNVDDKPDLLIVPGGGWIARSNRGAWAEANKGEILTVLMELHKRGTVLASVCAGAMLLAKAGLLKNRPATTNHNALEELKALGARIISARVVDDGDI